MVSARPNRLRGSIDFVRRQGHGARVTPRPAGAQGRAHGEDDPFDRDHAPPVGTPEALAPGLRVVTAPNAGPMTFTGTRSYIVGEGEVAVIDPGPADPRHLAALAAAVAGERVAAVLVTHAHRDHSAGRPRLRGARRRAGAGAGSRRAPPAWRARGGGRPAAGRGRRGLPPRTGDRRGPMPSPGRAGR